MYQFSNVTTETEDVLL